MAEDTPKQQLKTVKEVNKEFTAGLQESTRQSISALSFDDLWQLLHNLEQQTEPLHRLIARAENIHAQDEYQAIMQARAHEGMSTGEREAITRALSAASKEYLANLRGLAFAMDRKIEIIRERIKTKEVRTTRIQGKEE